MSKKQLTFEQYSKEALKTAVYPNKGKNLIYTILGLVGESGEVAEKYKKILRNKKGKFDLSDKLEMQKELGDILWYINATCYELNLKLDNVARLNIEKLRDRLKRGVLKSKGDNR